MANARILVVEDESIVAMDIKNGLQRLGYAVPAIAYSGEEAVQKAAETHPDLVLMDIRLKGKMDGVEAAEQIRARFDIPVVYLTAYADEHTLQRAKITEPFGYILKPFEERELHTAIETTLYKHKMERKLKESERWFATILKSIGDAVIATDAKGYVTFMNPLAEALTGWEQEDALGKDVTQVFHIVNEETHTLIENPATKALREGVVIDLAINHTLLIARDETEIPIDSSAAPIRDTKGNITGVVLAFRDITERRRAEEALRKAHDELKMQVKERTADLVSVNEQLQRECIERKKGEEAAKSAQAYVQNLINSSLDMIVSADKNRHIVEFNKAAQEAFGYSKEEVLGQHVDILYADPEEGQEVSRTLAETGQFIGEITNIRKNGETFPTFLSASILRNSAGEIVGVMGISRDITERKRAEEELKALYNRLQEANRRLKLAYAQMRDRKDRLSTLLYQEQIGFLIDRDGRILGVTEKGLESTGRSRIKLLGSNIVDLLNGDSQQELRSAIRQAWMGTSSQTFVWMIGPQAVPKLFKTKLTRMNLERERMLLVLMQESETE